MTGTKCHGQILTKISLTFKHIDVNENRKQHCSWELLTGTDSNQPKKGKESAVECIHPHFVIIGYLYNN